MGKKVGNGDFLQGSKLRSGEDCSGHGAGVAPTEKPDPRSHSTTRSPCYSTATCAVPVDGPNELPY